MTPGGPYQGMFQILRFNRRTYAAAAALLIAAFLLATRLNAPWNALLLAAALSALFWTFSSLLVSHYVYDRSPLYDLSWLANSLSKVPKKWLTIHAGLDEISPLLTPLFPAAEGRVLDIFDPQEMTEPSIAEARRISTTESERVPWGSLPISSGTFDAAILMFAAHELRSATSRVQFFRELARVLQQDGEVVLIEHGRDWRNFLAFGPGFLHFFSPRSWRRIARTAGFEVRTEFRLTPFVDVFVLRRSS
jgi:SAM-dependent methyltransferase